MWRNWNTCALLVRIYMIQPLWKTVQQFLKKIKNRITI